MVVMHPGQDDGEEKGFGTLCLRKAVKVRTGSVPEKKEKQTKNLHLSSSELNSCLIHA